MLYGLYVYIDGVLKNTLFIVDNFPFDFEHYCLFGLHLARIHDHYVNNIYLSYVDYIYLLNHTLTIYHDSAMFSNFLPITDIDFYIHVLQKDNRILQTHITTDSLYHKWEYENILPFVLSPSYAS